MDRASAERLCERLSEGAARIRRAPAAAAPVIAELIETLCASRAEGGGASALAVNLDRASASSLIRDMPDAVFVVDAGGRIVHTNAAAEAISGYAGSNLRSMTWQALCPADGAPGTEAASLRRWDGADGQFETVLRTKAGQRLNVQVSTGPIVRGEEGGGAFNVVRDISEQRQAERTLQDSEQRLRLAAEATGFGTYDYHPAERRSVWSAELYAIAGLDPSSPPEPGVIEQLVHPDDRSVLDQMIRASEDPAGTGWHEAEFRIVRPDGEVRWVRDTGRTLFEREGEARRPVRVVGTVQDITRRKVAELELGRLNRELQARVNERTAALADLNAQLRAEVAERREAEAAARRAEARYRLLLEHAPAITYATTAEPPFATTYISPAVERLLGFPAGRCLASPDLWRTQVHPEDRQRVQAALAQSQTSGAPFQSEYRMIANDGRVVWFRDHSVVVTDHDGKAARHGVMVDITESKAAAQELSTMQEIVDAGPVAIMGWRIEPGRWPVELASQNLERLFGYTAEEFRSGAVSWPDITHPDDTPRLEREVAEYLRQGRRRWEQQYRIRARDGTWRWVCDANRVIDDAEGQPARIQALLVDITEQKHAEQALRDSEVRFRSIVENAAAGVVLIDPHGHIWLVNEAACRFLGYSRSELLAMTVADVTLPEDRTASERFLEEIRGGARIGGGLEKRYLRKDGQVVWGHVSSQWVFDKAGNPQYSIGLIQDITAAKQTEHALRESEAKFHSLVENLNDIVYRCDGDGVLQYVSPQVERYGLDADAMVGRPFLEYVVAEDRAALAVDFQRTMTTGAEFPTEFRIRGAGGRAYWLEDHGRVQKDAQGRVVGLTGMLRDITEAKAMQRAIRESEQRLDLALSATELGLWERDIPSGRLVVDQRWAAMVGYDLDEAPRDVEGWQAMVHPDDLPRVRRALDDHLTGSTAHYVAEFRMRTRGGDWRWIESQGRVVDRDAEGAPVRLIGTHRDVTDRRRADDQLNQYQHKLRSLANQLMLVEERERRRLAVDLHDGLGQLLNLARMKLGALEQALDPDRIQPPLGELADVLDRAVHQASTLTFELSPPVLHELGLGPACRWLAEEMHDRYGLTVELAEATPVGSLDEQIATVVFRGVRELLINVAKHARVSTASLALAREAETLRVEVVDDGVGLTRGTEPWRVIGDPQRGGFGLFSLRERLEHLGGQVIIDSEPGQGTRVAIVAPLTPDQPPFEES